VSIVRKFTEEVKPPRSIYLKWPYGHPFGEIGVVNQQKTVLKDALRLLETATEPGVIVDLPYKWRREKYSDDGSAIVD
jgi:D-proline reductase (dithiol) PrdB